MTKTARVYGGSLYDLAAEEKLDGQIMEQMIAVRQIFRENPGYLKLLGFVRAHLSFLVNELNQIGIKIDMYRQEYRFTPAFAFIQAV